MGTQVYYGITIPDPEPTGAGGALFIDAIKDLAKNHATHVVNVANPHATWATQVDNNIIPDGNGTRNLGSSAARMGSIFGTSLVSVSGAYGASTASGGGSIIGGTVGGGALFAIGAGALAQGVANAGTLNAKVAGSLARGYVSGGYIAAQLDT